MENLKIELENCYWIKKLNKDFEFSNTSKVYSIYAPNWIMKTSFAKVFKKYQEWEEDKICDEMFPKRVTKHIISWITNYKENIFAIEPYIEDFKSKKITTLLLKKDLKERYEKEYFKIEESEKILYENLIEKSGLKDIYNIKSEILTSFWEKDIFDVILTQETKILDWKSYIYNEIIYDELFNSTSFSFLNTEKHIIEKYINRYDTLIADSKILGKDFNHYKARKAWDILDKTSFFKWWHKVWFVNKNDWSFEDILSKKVFLDKIEEEEKVLFKDPKISDFLIKLDKKIKNAKLEKLRDYLFNNKYILSELRDLAIFRRKLSIDYFKENSGKIFDPKLVTAFFEVFPKILIIKDKFQEKY